MTWDMLALNDMLPFTFTESKIDNMIVRLYLKRNSFLNGILFASEFSGSDLIHESEFESNRDVFE